MNGIQLEYSEGAAVLEPSVRRGRLLTGDTLRQNQALILSLHKGELKEKPAVGVGVSDMLLDDDPIYWRTLIKEQLEMDGQTVAAVEVTRAGIEIQAEY